MVSTKHGGSPMLLVQNGKRIPFVQAASGSSNASTLYSEGNNNSLPKEFAVRKIPKFPDCAEDPPEIESEESSPTTTVEDRGSNASSLSDNVVIPGLKDIVFSDNHDEEGMEDHDDDDDDENLKIMAMLVKRENDRLEQQITRMTTYVESMEDAKLQEECRQEIELESQSHPETENDKKKRARERYEKKRRQRMKEKEESRQRRRAQEEEKRKKKKAMAMKKKFAKRQEQRLKKRNEQRAKRRQELEAAQGPEVRPTKGQIVHLFDKYFYKPFEVTRTAKAMSRKSSAKASAKWGSGSVGQSGDFAISDSMHHHLGGLSSDDSSDSEEEELPERGINFEGFKAGLKTLGIDSVLNKSEVESVFDHMCGSSREYGINAVDFCHFLKQNAITLEPKLATIQRKINSSLSKQQDKEDKLPKEDCIDTDQPLGAHGLSLQIDVGPQHNTKLDGNAHTPISPLTPNLTPDDADGDDEEEDEDDENDEDDQLEDLEFDVRTPNGSRRRLSLSESMSLGLSRIPSNVPRKSFKQISYNWNDSISKESFNKYKRLRKTFADRYVHTPTKTKDEELMTSFSQRLLAETLTAENKENTSPNMSGSNATFKIVVDEHDEKENGGTTTATTAPSSTKTPSTATKPQQQHTVEDTDASSKTKTKRVNDHQHRRSSSRSLSRKSPGSLTTLPGIDETKNMDKISTPTEGNDDDEEAGRQRRGSRSTVKSLQKIKEYEGNEDIEKLRKLYKQQHKMKQKLQRLRNRSLMRCPAPPKPNDIEQYLDDKSRYILKELRLCICKTTRYTGLANFGPNGELGIEIEFTSDCDENGYISGRRVIHFKGMKQAEGRGRIWADVAWNGEKYVGCIRFEWKDEGDGVTTKFEFDSVKHEIDVDHSFFQGTAVRYPSDCDPRRRNTQLIMHHGFFDFVCVSARRRNIRRNSLLQYHTLDINEMTENELEKVPKYVRRMSAYTEKIDQLYDKDQVETKDTLFGEAINAVAAIQQNEVISSDAQMSDLEKSQ